MITTVSSSAALTDALNTAHAGDTILLAGGDYGSIKLQNLKFTGEVTITSADPAHRAVFSSMEVYNSQNLTFRGLEINAKGTVQSTASVYTDSTDHIWFDQMDVHGRIDDSFANDQSGISTHGSTNVKVTNSNFHDLYDAIASGFDNGVTIANNYIHNVAMDGIHVGGTSNITVAQNFITDMMSFGAAHHDAIQVFNAGKTLPMTNITIVDNTYVRGAGQVVQGIFIGNDSGIAYENLTISRNAIIGGAYHGITVDIAKNVTVTDNLVQGYTDMESWLRETGGTTTFVQNNKATEYILNTNTDTHTLNNETIKSVAVGDTSALTAWQAVTGHLTVDATTVTHTLTGGSVAGPLPSAPTATPAPPVGLTLTGTAGDDALTGGAGNDTLNGLAGRDTMAGGAGNDTYNVDSGSDVVTEGAGAGVDTVISTAGSFTLGANVENETLVGSQYQEAKGNGLDNVLIGNKVSSFLGGYGGADTLVSVGGVDQMWGGDGKDVFRFEALSKTATYVYDFVRGVDTLDLRPLLTAYHGADPVGDGYVKFEISGAATKVFVDVDGAQGAGGFVQVATLADVTGAVTQGVDWIF